MVREIVTSKASPLSMTLTAPEKLVALCIADHMRTNPSAWPSQLEIGRWCSLSMSAVKRATRRLCADDGPLSRTSRPGRGGWLYRLREGVHTEPRPQGTPSTVNPHPVHTDPSPRPQGTPKRKGSMNEAGQAPRLNGTPTRTTVEPFLIQARSAWAESVGDAPRWFDGDLRKLVTGSRTGADVLEGLRRYLAVADLQKPGAELLRGFTQNAGRWCAKPKPKASEPEVYTGSDEQRRAKAARYGITL